MISALIAWGIGFGGPEFISTRGLTPAAVEEVVETDRIFRDVTVGAGGQFRASVTGAGDTFRGHTAGTSSMFRA